MIPSDNKRIKQHPVTNLEAVQGEYHVIVEDMIRNAGRFIPDPNWLGTEDTSQSAESYDRSKALDVVLSESHYKGKVAKMENLMAAWVGGADKPTPSVVSKYRRFLDQGDVLKLWTANMESDASEQRIPLTRPDLGSLMDLNLIYAFRPPSGVDGISTIVEVGGGYGRLAEAMFNIFRDSVRYVMVDAVPASLYYAKKYLAAACPDARIGSYYDSCSDEFDISLYDISIIPVWHFERLNRTRYDVCINIESMQEMSQEHVTYYIGLFESVATDDATVYISNAHDYYFRGTFDYPRNWQKLFCGNTPRSWRPDHPTEIFRRGTLDFSEQNKMCDALHQYRVWLDADSTEFLERNGMRNLIAPMVKKGVRTGASKIRSR